MAEKERRRRESRRSGLIDYVVHISPDLEKPVWLGPYADKLEAAIRGTEEIRCVVAAPPQHGKTLLVLHAYLLADMVSPGRSHYYVTYNELRASEVARDFQRIADRAGVLTSGTLQGLRLPGGSTVRFTSVNGSATGFSCTGLAVVDDPIKGYAESRSAQIRKNAIGFFDTELFTRRHPGTSFIVMATRWDVEDPSGILVKRGWQYVNLRAIAEGETDAEGRVLSDPLHRLRGESLWPARKPPAYFAEDKLLPFRWAAMFQGEPRPEGGTVFSASPAMYSVLPTQGYRGAYGLDLAYSSKTQSDWSICLELWAVDTKDPKRPLFYVVDVQRKHVDAPSFALTLKAKRASRPWPMRWYAAGTEKGAADFMRRSGIPISTPPICGDKFIRSTAVAAAWNGGRVLLPDPEHFNVPWLADFLDVVKNFTGTGDETDDDVDALAAAHDELVKPTANTSFVGIARYRR